MTQEEILALEEQAQNATESSGDPSWTGEVDGYAVKEITKHENGAAIIVFHQPAADNDYTTKLFLNPIDFDQLNVFEGQTAESTALKAIQKENRLFKQLAKNYKTEEEVNTAFKDAKNFDAKVEALKSCLPDNVGEITGRIVIGYNQKGYLTIPNRLQWDSDVKRWLPFFTTNPEQQLMDLPNNLTRSKPQVSTEVTEEEAVDY